MVIYRADGIAHPHTNHPESEICIGIDVFSRVYSGGDNMTALKNAPLIYTLGMIQFPKVPGIERFIDLFLDKIRNEYPHCRRSQSSRF